MRILHAYLFILVHLMHFIFYC